MHNGIWQTYFNIYEWLLFCVEIGSVVLCPNIFYKPGLSGSVSCQIFLMSINYGLTDFIIDCPQKTDFIQATSAILHLFLSESPMV
jgi:hypothetical protein